MINTVLSVLRRRMPAGGIGRHMSWVMLQSGLETFSMTVAGLLIARWFGDVLLGQLTVILAGVQLITMMADGLYAGIVRQVSQERISSRAKAFKLGWRLSWTTIMLALAATSLLVLAVVVSQHRYAVFSWLVLAGCITMGRVARTSFEAAFRSLGEFRLPALVGGITVGIGAFVIIALAAAGYGVTMYLAVQAGALAVNTILIGWVYHRHIVRAAALEPATVEEPPSADDPRLELLRYTFPLVMRGAIAFLYLKVNVWLIMMMTSDADTGQFGFFDRVLTLPRLLMSAALAAFAPRIVPALADVATLGRLTARVQGIMLVLSVLFAGLFLLSPWLILPFFPQYEAACRMLQIYAPVLPITGLALAGSVLLMQGGFPKEVMWLSIWGSVANVVFVYGSLKVGGVLLATATMSAVHAITGLLLIYLTYRLLKIRFHVSLG